MSRLRWYVAACGLGLLGSIAFLRPAAHGVIEPAESIEFAERTTASSSGDALVATPVPEGPFDVVRPRLENAAAAGDPDAAFRLGRALMHCLDYRPITDGALVELMTELIANAGSSIRIGGRALDDEVSIDTVLFAQEETRRTCADTASLRARPPALDAHAYIEQAARAGHPGAAALYPELVFREFRTPVELIENAEEVARRRDHARAYLLAAVRTGEPEALLAASRAYSVNGWLAPDPEQALTYWLAYTRTDAFARIPASLASERTAELEAMATASQQERAAARAAHIFDAAREQKDAH